MMSDSKRLSLCNIFILFFISKHVDGKVCGYHQSMKCGDITTPSNAFLRSFRADDSVSQERLKEIFQHFNVVRTVGSPGHANVRQYIKSTLTQLGWGVEEDPFSQMTPYGRKNFVNVVASSSPNATTKLALACHYDSKDFRTFEFIGATDSAVPCAIIIDVAKALNSQLLRVKNLSLELIFFDGEEAFGEWSDDNSIYGAKHLAQRWLREPSPQLQEKHGGDCTRMDSLNAFVLLDLIGGKGMQFHNFFAENTCSTALFAQFRRIEQRLSGLGMLMPGTSNMFSRNELFNGGGIEDDHLPFKAAGVNIVHLISLPFPREWHKESDNAQALQWGPIYNMNVIIRSFVSQYFSD